MAKVPQEQVVRRYTGRYREMATDERREAEALEWVEATIGDISAEPRSRRRSKLPVARAATGQMLPYLTNLETHHILEEEEARRGAQEPSVPVTAGNRLKLPLIECVHEARPGEEMTPERVSERLIEEETGATEADGDLGKS